MLVFAVQTAFCLSAGAFGYESELSAAFQYCALSRGAESAGEGFEFGKSDWTAVCWARLGGETAGYEESVREGAAALLGSDGFVKPTELQRAAIALSAVSECPQELINAAAYCNADFARQGFNAWIWALIAANCSGLEAEETALYTRRDLASEIISRQLPDGGFTLRGESADTDMTAAAIYALAPLFEDEEIAAALEKAVARLSELQLGSGGFSSMGIENCESTAQALIAFTAVGLSEEDSRVSRALAALLGYRREDGGFAHLSDGATNSLATVQAIEALTALSLSEGGERLFDVRKAEETAPAESAEMNLPAEALAEEETDPAETSVPAEEEPFSLETCPPEEQPEQTEPEAFPQSGSLSGTQIKLILSLIPALGAAGLIAAAAIRRKPSLLAGAAVCAAVSGAVWLLDIRSAEEYYAQAPQPADITVTFSVRCDAALEKTDEMSEELRGRIPEDGAVIPKRELGLPEGATAFDALISAAREEKIRVDYNGSTYGVYVSAIGFLREFDLGEMSGWMYRVNGEFPDCSAGAFALSDGDAVEFVYTCDMGRDI